MHDDETLLKESEPVESNPIKEKPSTLPLKVNEVLQAELNVAKFSSFIFAPSHSKTGQARVKTWLYEDPETGIKTRAKILIECVQGESLNTFDHRVLLGLHKLYWETARELDGSFSFSLQELARAIGRKWSHKLRLELKASLRRLRKVPLTWLLSFYDKGVDRLRSFEEPMNILAGLRIYELSEDRTGKRLRTKTVARFNEHMDQNLQKRLTKPYIHDVMLKIRGEISLNLYGFLDVIMASKKHWERRSAELLRDDLSAGEYRWPADRKRLLSRAIREINGKPISTGILHLAMEKTVDQKDYKLVVDKTLTQRQVRQPRLNGQQQDLVSRILEITHDPHSRGFYEKAVRLCPSTLIDQALSATKDAYLSHTVEAGNRGRYFTGAVKHLAKEQGVALGAETPPALPDPAPIHERPLMAD